ncbi:MAG: methyltransferase domain-containing protein [Dehalococcoidia bacterium]
MLISEAWCDQNEKLHFSRPDFGSKASTKRAFALRMIVRRLGARTVLDYGCGKGWLASSGLFTGVQSYDPAVPEFSAMPVAADVVACWDVLEHVEPECLSDVLGHIASLGRVGAHLVIGTRPDKHKVMEDGRNPHLIIEPAEWWLPRLRGHWADISGRFDAGELAVVCR